MDLSTNNRPMMEELKNGRWPSFITEIEKSESNEMSHELLDLLEESYERKVPLWKHGGIVGCLLYTSPSPRDLSTSRMPSSA